MISLSGVCKRYGETIALLPTDLEVAPGTTAAIIGPSGGGKSTLLKIALGLVVPDAGTVEIAGERLEPGRVLALRRRAGYVVQGGGLFPHLTAAANASLVARHLGWDRERVCRRLAELADLARLPPAVLERYPAQLSGGQAQRVGIMRALMLDPAVLLLDEPLGALDPVTRLDLQEDLRRVFRQLRKSVALVTHDLGEAAFFADQVVLVREGRVLQRGDIRDLLERPADPFVARFVAAQRSPLLPGGERR